MATFKKFEEIQCWQKARELTAKIYHVSKRGHFLKGFWIKRPNSTCVSLNNV